MGHKQRVIPDLTGSPGRCAYGRTASWRALANGSMPAFALIATLSDPPETPSQITFSSLGMDLRTSAATEETTTTTKAASCRAKPDIGLSRATVTP